MTLGKRIRQFRLQKAISQEKLAEELNVSRSRMPEFRRALAAVMSEKYK